MTVYLKENTKREKSFFLFSLEKCSVDHPRTGSCPQKVDQKAFKIREKIGGLNWVHMIRSRFLLISEKFVGVV